MTYNTEALPPLPEPTYIDYWGNEKPERRKHSREGEDERIAQLFNGFDNVIENADDYTKGYVKAMRAMFAELMTDARAALAQRQQVPTTAWLVEWRFNGVQWLYLWSSAPGGFSFTSDASKALRFARREDAEAALQWARDTDAVRRPIGSLTRQGLALGEMLVTEHDWPALPAAPSAQAEPCQWCCGTGRFADHACRFCAGKAKGSVFAAPSAQAEPQVPLTDEQIAEFGALCVMNRRSKKTARELLAEYREELARGIGKQEL